jgi:malonate transporter and related proteins
MLLTHTQQIASNMFSTFEILLPIFALIFSGYIFRKRNIFRTTAATEINKLVVWIALPALLFEIMAHITWKQLNQPDFVAAFGLGCAIPFAGVLVIALLKGRHLADASIEAIAACYPNAGYIGLPLCLLLYGNSSLILSTIATIIVVCIMFSVAIVLIEIGLEKESRPHYIFIKIFSKLLCNPLIIAPIAGVLVSAMHLDLPASTETFLKLAGAVASPCALICLGIFLGEERQLSSSLTQPWMLIMIKLIFQPVLTWWLAAYIFNLPPQIVHIAVLLSALPTGTGPFMLAEFYMRESVVTSNTILITTLISVLTLTVLIGYFS